MGAIKNAILEALQSQGTEAQWKGSNPQRIQSAKQAKYADTRKAKRNYTRGVHKANKEV